MAKIPRVFLVLTLSSCAFVPLGIPRPLQDSVAIVTTWEEAIAAIEGHIIAGEWRKADRMATRLEAEMVNQIVEGPDTNVFLWRIALLRALTLAGKGDLEQAAWTFYMASAFAPENAHLLDLTRYGKAGEYLAHLPDIDCAFPRARDCSKSDSVVEPKLRKHPRPKFPEAQRGKDRDCRVVVEMRVTADGRPTIPRLLESDGSSVFVYATLLAIQEWRFEPATEDGKPIPFVFTLKVNFNIRA
jgi:TonB family protein